MLKNPKKKEKKQDITFLTHNFTSKNGAVTFSKTKKVRKIIKKNLKQFKKHK